MQRPERNGQHERKMKKFFILFILTTSFNFCSFSQFVKYDTVKDKQQYVDLIKYSQTFLTLLKEKNLKEIKQNMHEQWGNDSLFKEVVKSISDSIKKYGMPNSNRLFVIKDTITVQNPKKKTEFIELVYCLNTPNYDKNKTLSIQLTFNKELGLNKVMNFRFDIPVNIDAATEEFYKLYPQYKPK